MNRNNSLLLLGMAIKKKVDLISGNKVGIYIYENATVGLQPFYF